MGIRSIEIDTPAFRDDEIFIDEEETRAILRFFWPSRASQIDGITDSLNLRRFAQQLLIAGADGSYAMGYVHATFSSLSGSPPKGVLSILRKLATKSAKHWFKNASGKNLQNPKIYLSVRNAIAAAKRSDLEGFIAGIAINGGQRMHFYAHIHTLSSFA